MDELYDLALDPYEVNNVITDSEYVSVLEEMRRELRRLLGRALGGHGNHLAASTLEATGSAAPIE